MPGSDYYYPLYKAKRDEAKAHSKNAAALQKVVDALANDFYDDIRNVNNELDDLVEDLKQAVRHNAVFTREAGNFIGRKEKGTGADRQLSAASGSLQDEIGLIRGKCSRAEADRDNYYRQYEEKKREEQQALLDLLFG